MKMNVDTKNLDVILAKKKKKSATCKKDSITQQSAVNPRSTKFNIQKKSINQLK